MQDFEDGSELISRLSKLASVGSQDPPHSSLKKGKKSKTPKQEVSENDKGRAEEEEATEKKKTKKSSKADNEAKRKAESVAATSSPKVHNSSSNLQTTKKTKSSSKSNKSNPKPQSTSTVEPEPDAGGSGLENEDYQDEKADSEGSARQKDLKQEGVKKDGWQEVNGRSKPKPKPTPKSKDKPNQKITRKDQQQVEEESQEVEEQKEEKDHKGLKGGAFEIDEPQKIQKPEKARGWTQVKAKPKKEDLFPKQPVFPEMSNQKQWDPPLEEQFRSEELTMDEKARIEWEKVCTTHTTKRM